MVSEEKNDRKIGGNGSIRSIFMHADGFDKCLMVFGFIGAVLDGFTDRIHMLFGSQMLNAIASSSKLDPQEFTHTLNKIALIWLYIAGLSWVACFLEAYCWTRTGERQASRMRAKYVKALLRQDLTYFDLDSNATSTSEVITSISYDTLLIQDTISEKVPDCIKRISTFLTGYAVAFILAWKLSLASLPLAALLVLSGWLCGRSLVHVAAQITKEHNKAISIAEMSISSIRTVYAFVGEKKFVEQYSSALDLSMKLGLKHGLIKGLAIASNAIGFVIWSVLCYYGSWLAMYEGLQGGTFIVVVFGITYGVWALSTGFSNLKDITEACCAGQRVMNAIDRVPIIDSEDEKGIILKDVVGKIEFKQVCFAYPSRPESVIFENFSLTIAPRKTFALVGASGSGKSTALLLLQRFYDPFQGQIFLDGVSIDKFRLKWLRSQMALVSQEPSLFSTTIKENILLGKEDAKMDDIIEASVASDAHTFVSQLPHGYETQVGERGIQLSGGQKQRIAIARAIIRKPRILLLDEATSALDSESERAVQEAIDRVAIGRTTIIVAHRLSTIKNVDTIVVMESGQVKETGSHDELIQDDNGLYTSLVRLQRLETNDKKTTRNCDLHSSHNEVSKDDEKDGLLASNMSNKSYRISSIPYTENHHYNHHKSPKASFWRLLRLNKPEWRQMILGCLSAILYGVIQPLFSICVANTIMLYHSSDHVEIKEKIRIYALCFLLLFAFSLMVTITQQYCFAYMGEYLTLRVRKMMFSKILNFEVEWFDKEENSTGVTCSRLAKDANLVRSLIGDRISLLVQVLSAVTIAWIVGLMIAWRLAIVCIATQPLVILCFYTRRVLMKNMSKKSMKEQNESTKIVIEAVSNFRTVTTFSSQQRILNLLEKAQEEPRKENVRQSWYAGFSLGCSSGIAVANACFNYWYGGKLISQGYISPLALFQIVILVIGTGRSIADLGSLTTLLARGWEAIQSVFLILDKETKIEPSNLGSYQPENVDGHVELCNVYFAYPTRPDTMIFQGFSINVKSGKSMALVGRSGSGKSTIIGLIERFYDPLKGVVKIDGRDLRSYHLWSLRKYMALVNQEPTLFSGTIRENIAYGLSNEISEAEIVEAARASNAHNFITRQADGYDTNCGDKGIQLSGGQKQRIAIARAVLRNPMILLLDEATSALDSHSEKVVQEALERLMTHKTSIVVAHRLCTIQNCDEIVVLDKGRVVEKGTHSSLMAMGTAGAYHSLASLHFNDSTSKDLA